MALSCAPIRRSSSSSFLPTSRRCATPSRICTKARTTNNETSIARGELSTVAAIRAPCSVKAKGGFRFPPQLEVTNCDFKLASS